MNCKLLFFSLLCLLCTARGADLFLPTLSEPVIPDGRLDEPVWDNAARLGSFSLLGKPDTPPQMATDVRLWSDGARLYVGWKCQTAGTPVKTAETRTDGLQLWNDDAVELFVSPTSGAETYYHFTVNAAGIRGDAKVQQSGFEHHPEWNGRWNAAVTVEPNSYTVEMAIDFANFPEAAGKNRSTWRIATSRNHHMPNELSCFPGTLGNTFHHPERFAILNAVTIAPGVFPVTAEGITFRPGFDGDAAGVRGTLECRFRPRTTLREARLLLRLYGPNHSTGLFSTEIPVAVKEEVYTAELPVQLFEPGIHRVEAELSAAGPPPFRWQEDLKLTATALELEMIAPRYRNLILPGMKLDKIRFALTIRDDAALTGKVRFTLTGANSETVATAEVAAQRGRMLLELPFAADRLPDGDYRLNIAAGTNQAGIVLHKSPVPAGRPEVWFDECNNFIVNGKTEFPLGFYYDAPSWPGSAGKFNTLVEFRDPARNSQLARYGLFGFGNLREFTEVASTSGRIDAKLLDAATRLINQPLSNFTGWYVADEPELRTAHPGVYRQAIEKIRELDPYRPLLTTHNSVHGLALDADLADIVTVDPYVGFRLGHDGPLVAYDRIAVHVAEAVKAVGNRKPVWAVLEAYPANYFGGAPETARYPTIQEERLMTTLALIHGARGIIYWDSSALAARGLWPALKHYSSELAALKKFLIAPDTTEAARQGSIHYRWKQADASQLLMAVNLRSETAKLAIPAPNGVYQAVSESRSVTVQDGVLTDEFGPYAVHLYVNESIDTGNFSRVLAEYTLDDSRIGRARSGNLADFRNGATAATSSTSRWSKSYYALNGEPIYRWNNDRWKDAAPWFELTLSRPAAVRQIVIYSETIPPKLLYRTANGWKPVESEPECGFLVYDDTRDEWFPRPEAKADQPGVRFWKYTRPLPETTALRIEGLRTLALDVY